ncbi:DNA-directed RNA polymerase subunit omega [Akkermansia glycaniphila]|uniref:Rna polymerase subunit omega/k/rpb6 n=1 Tax=Akkermansia glycaniphila TaxID=1679444 RepID=A0A1C7PEX5_9BACT|nr:DNA-directed RNA polymerase subunit omega [Akkermansia glycaniphila]MBT9449502.1 DNA-directed RNA polymerase subunit omega [Akkermansia glycaniphila]OCA02388.1 DNA-directed RNA polymerase subunit omega [Akkermansia glycaniphila]OCA04126.1 DNA-directed RNA polymerase subunit omega [Akkermansia glycaniphila]SEH88786.1 rna polymerase subunit omega/k/rpb6 [Akkermansia glycaniphila]
MKTELIDKAAQVVQDPQLLVNIVSQRVAQLNSGRSPLIPTTPHMGAGDIALTEIIEGKLVWQKKEESVSVSTTDEASGDDDFPFGSDN